MTSATSRRRILVRLLVVPAVLLAAACADGSGPAPDVTGHWYGNGTHLYLAQRGDSVTGQAVLGLSCDCRVSGVYSAPSFILNLRGMGASGDSSTGTLVVHFANDQILSGLLHDRYGKTPITLSRR